MSSFTQQRPTGAAFLNVKAQVATTNNTIFPFSSPNIDEPSPLGSDRSDLIYQSNIPYGPDASSSTLRHEENRRVNGKMNISVTLSPRRMESGTVKTSTKPRPELQVVTDFPKPQVRTGEVIFNEVTAKHPQQGRNKARSIVSQKGIKLLTSPNSHNDSTHVISHLKDLIKSKRIEKLNATQTSTVVTNPGLRQRKPSPTRSSVIFGLRVPESEAGLHSNDDVLHSSITLVTPATPRIIVTPADENRKDTSGTKIERRFSSESQQQILPDSTDTARPISQGWWNLALSPMLSRAGTLKTLRARNEVIPPVPPMPAEKERALPVQTPVSIMSPPTPRRAGLATVRTSTWSQWTDQEAEVDLADDDEDISELSGIQPTIPRDHLIGEPTPGPHYKVIQGSTGEGLAAEYYHACAIEQLAGITYFDCINHSCALYLPELRSVGNVDVINLDKLGLDKDSHNAQIFDRDVSANLSHNNTSNTHLDLPIHMTSTDTAFANRGTVQSKDGHSIISPLDSGKEPIEIVSPNIRQANMATFTKARAVDSRESSPALLSVTATSTKKQLSIEPPTGMPHQLSVISPGPVSPEATRSIAPAGAVPMAPLQNVSAQSSMPLIAPVPLYSHALVPPYQPPPIFIYHQNGQSSLSQPVPIPETTYPVFNSFPPPMFNPNQQPQPHSTYTQPLATSMSTAEQSVNPMASGGIAREVGNSHGERTPESSVIEKKKTSEKISMINRLGRLFRSSKKEKDQTTKSKTKVFGVPCCFGRSKKANANNRRCTIYTTIILIVVIVLCILFAIFFTRGKGNANPIDSQWLNLTGYPAMPTGVSTIARPNLAASQNKCTQPDTLWSCSVPKEDQAGILPNDPTQPNFRFQIRFRNGTVPANMTVPLGKRAPDSNDDLFVPNPTPPGQLDQIFLGNTTDNTTRPFDGEITPFFITFLSAVPGQTSTANTTKKLTSRQTVISNPRDSIPPPAIAPSGSAAPASLLPTTPFPISQPVKLYNRGLRDEHYGFYMYFDRSIFMSGISLRNDSSADNNLTPTAADQNGGSTKQAANARCTWSQTRFVVKMYTNPAFGAKLLAGPPTNNTNSKIDSATNFNRPGSFPYPTTILLDRHGGEINKKLIYCYGMNSGFIVTSQKSLVPEDRKVGGVLINAAPGIIDTGSSGLDPNLGGIDGGTGGCGCTWQNWS